MASWAALNAGERDVGRAGALERATEEAQDAHNTALYEQALRHQQQKQVQDAREIYLALIEGDAALSPRLQYLCQKNLAVLEFEARAYEDALQYFANALELDGTDVVVWYQMGKAAVETGRMLEEGFQVDGSYWPLAQTLCEVLFEIGDVDEYERIASHVRDHDPQCPSIRLLDAKLAALSKAAVAGDRVEGVAVRSKKRASLGSRELKLLRRARGGLAHMHEISADALKKRRLLYGEIQQTLTRSSRPVEYLLERNTWRHLGMLLLQVYDDANSESVQTVAHAHVRITVADFDESRDTDDSAAAGVAVDAATEKGVDVIDVDADEENDAEATAVRASSAASGTHPEAADRTEERPFKKKKKKRKSSFAASESAVAVVPSDNDTQDSGVATSELDEPQPARRKSRRHEERLREEHAAAVKIALEKNLAYRLQTFLPETWSRQLANATDKAPEKTAGWTQQFAFKLTGSKFQICDQSSNHIQEFDLFVVPGNDAIGQERSSGSTYSGGHSRRSQDGGSTSGIKAMKISKQQIADFVARVSDQAPGAVTLLKKYLNQCGEWAHMKLATGDDEIHSICFWVEKLIRGALGGRPKQSQGTVELAATAEQSGLTPRAKLFLLELKFDKLIRQPAHGKQRKKQRQHLLALIATADNLLLELCLGGASDEQDGSAANTGVVRLFWLLARMHERCGRANIAKEYFVKCQEEMLAGLHQEGEEEDSDPIEATIFMPNQKVDSEISLEILEEKISGLQYSDVCSDAQQCFATGDYNRAVSLLLGHFFPARQPPRLVDLLREFELSESVSENEERRLIDILMESFSKSATHSPDDALLFLVTLLFHVATFIENLGKEEEVGGALPSEQILESGLNAIKFILAQLKANVSKRAVSDSRQQLLQACCLNCLKPSILLLFDAPKEVFQSICAVLVPSERAVLDAKDSGGTNEHLMAIEAVARTFHTIRSFDEANFRDLFAKLPSPANKKKQSRRDRVRGLLVELLRFLNWYLRYNGLSAAIDIDAHKRSVLMLHCRTMMKEEEEIISRREDKTARQLFGNAAILFLLLCSAPLGESVDQGRKTLTDLVTLLHNRMAQHDICGLSFFEEVNGAFGGGSEGSCFLEASIWVLSKYTDANTHDESSKEKAREDQSESDENDGEADEDSPFNKELAQCYHCMYDVQILSGCEDHKTGNTCALLQRETPTKRPNAMRLAQFAVPILLSRPPKNNGQKKENLKLLGAIRGALKETHSMEHAQTRYRPRELQSFLAPSNLLEWDGRFPGIDDEQASSEPDETGFRSPLDHLWYLLGENYILSRVRRRGNAGELMEMEVRVKERVAFLMTDVLYYRPGRIKSWIRLGTTMKELYHATSDACAVILGRKRKIAALHKYTSTLPPLSLLASDVAPDTEATPPIKKFTFNEIVLGMSLFDKMKRWDELEQSEQDGYRMVIGHAASDVKVEAAPEDRVETFSMEEYTIYYIVQVIEFARRCFAMAAHLAERSLVKKLEARATEKSKKTDSEQSGDDDDDDSENDGAEEIGKLRTTVIESNEECGLLLYNVLQELSAMNQAPRQPFPDALYLRLAAKAFSYFRKGLDMCEGVDKSEEVRFRLSFMCGKTLKKQLRREQKAKARGSSGGKSPRKADQTSPKSIIDYFAMAEKAHEDGEMEHALVHAFYALQAMRMEMVLRQPVRVEDLRLVCEHYFAEEEEEESDDDDDDMGNESSEGRSVESAHKKAKESAKSAKDDPLKMTKEEVFKLLDKTKGRSKKSELALHVARGWLYLNVIDALESIPNEDRYFHPSRYVLAQGVYRMDEFVHGALRTSKDAPAQALMAALGERLSPPGASQDGVAAAERALKELTPLFDKKRPQIVAIWLSEHVPTAKKFEELNQRQMKYDRYRLKYWHFYIRLLEESGAYGKIKEVGTWVLACKEEHDVIDEMLGLALQARGSLLRSRIQRFSLEGSQAKSSLAAVLNLEGESIDGVQSAAKQQRAAALLKLLGKTYTYYLDVVDSHHRLVVVMENHQELLQNGELLLVYLFLLGAIETPGDFPLPDASEDAPQIALDMKPVAESIRMSLLEATAASNAVDVDSAQWRTLLDATRAFCEGKWPERMGKGKLAKSRLRGKPPVPASTPAPIPGPAPASSPAVAATATATASASTVEVTPTANKMALENLTTSVDSPIEIEDEDVDD